MPSDRSRICARSSAGSPVTAPSSRRSSCGRGERLEEERGEAALRRAPRRPPLEQLRAGGRDDEDRPVARPVEQVLDEVEQRIVGPVQILEEQDRRRRIGKALEEDAPRAEQVLLVARAARLQPEQLGQARLDEAPLFGIRDVLIQRRPQLRQGGRALLVLDDAGAHPDHLGQRPERDAVAVGEASASMPPDVGGQAVDVLLELPGQPRLADASDADHGHQVRSTLIGRGVIELLRQPKLGITAGEWRLDLARPHRPADEPNDAHGSPQVDRQGLALHLLGPDRLVVDRGLGGLHRVVADEHVARLSRRLDPRCRVDDVAGNHPLVRRIQRDGRFAGEDAGAGSERRDADLFSQGLDRLGQLERGPHGPLGVVLVRHRRAPHRHDRIADELLDHAAVAPDQAATGLEVPGQEVANLLRVAGLGERRESDEVREHDRDEPPLRGRTREHLDGFAACGPIALRRARIGDDGGQRRPAFAAELRARRVWRATRRAGNRQPPTALAAELARRLVRCATARAGHPGTLSVGRFPLAA